MANCISFNSGRIKMPKILVRYVRCIESLNALTGRMLTGGIFVLIGILLIEIVSRYVFNAPPKWSIELSLFVLGFYFCIGAGYTLLTGAHIRMDALYGRWTPKRKAIADVATFGLLAVYLIVFIVGGIEDAAYALEYTQRTRSMWGPPLAPIKIILTVGATLLLLQGIALFIRDLATICGKEI